MLRSLHLRTLFRQSDDGARGVWSLPSFVILPRSFSYALSPENRVHRTGKLGEDGTTMTSTLIALAAAALVAVILPTGIG